MVILEWVIKIGGAISALGIIYAAVLLAVKKIFSPFFKDIKADIEELKKHSLENYLTGLRLTVMNADMPLGERIVAADKYIKLGGNGDVKKYAIKELHINDVQHDD